MRGRLGRRLLKEKAPAGVKRAANFFFNHEWFVPPFPAVTQIQTRSGCNARCYFCPSGKTGSKISHGTMPDWLFRKIVDELADHSPRRISPYLMNEPLLDRDLASRIAYIEAVKPPRCKTRILTNASLLTEETSRHLIECGLNSLIISIQGVRKADYEETMKGLDFEQTVENVRRFLKLKRKLGSRYPVVEVWIVETDLVRASIPEFTRYWTSLGVRVQVRRLENRTSRRLLAHPVMAGTSWRHRQFCDRLNKAWIIWNGDMVVCCCDWERSVVLGNVREKTISEVWNSSRYQAIRSSFARGVTVGTICDNCLEEND